MHGRAQEAVATAKRVGLSSSLSPHPHSTPPLSPLPSATLSHSQPQVPIQSPQTPSPQPKDHRPYCFKSILRIDIKEANKLKSESNRNPKLFCPLVEVSVVDEEKKKIPPLEFKTKRVSYLEKTATWNHPAVLVFAPEYKMMVWVRVLDDDDSLGEAMLPVESFINYVDSDPTWVELGNSGRILLHAGWYNGRDERTVGSCIDVPLSSRVVPPLNVSVVSGRKGNEGTNTPTSAKSERARAGSLVESPKEARNRAASHTVRPSEKLKVPGKKELLASRSPDLGKKERIAINFFKKKENVNVNPPQQKKEQKREGEGDYYPPQEAPKLIQDLENFLVEVKKSETKVEGESVDVQELKAKLAAAEKKIQLEEEVRTGVEDVLDKFAAKVNEANLSLEELQIQVNMKALLIEEKELEIRKIQEELESKGAACDKLRGIAEKYKRWDKEAREALAFLGSNSTSQVEYTEEELATEDTRISNNPLGYATFLMNSETLENLNQVRDRLVKEDAVWIKNFINEGGLDGILSCIQRVEGHKNPDFKLVVREAQLIAILRILFKKQSIIDLIFHHHSDTMRNITEIISLSPHVIVRSEFFILLCGLALYSRGVYHFISSVLRNLGKTTKKYSIFPRILNENSANLELLTSTVCLLNSLIVGEQELRKRMKLRSLLKESDIDSILNKTKLRYENEKNGKDLILQIEKYYTIQQADEKKLLQIRFVGNMDLHSLGSIFDRLVMQTEFLGCQDTLLTILQHLLLIPDVSPNPQASYSFVECAVRRATYKEESKIMSNLSWEELHREVAQMFIRERDRLSLNQSPQEQSIGTAISDTLPSEPAVEGAEVSPPQILSTPAPSLPSYTTSFSIPPAPPSLPNYTTSYSIPPAPLLKTEDIISEVVPPPQKEMRRLFLKKIPDNEVSEYWEGAQPDLAQLENIFPELEQNFFATKSAVTFTKPPQKQKKIEILPMQAANNISILRAQFRGNDDDDIVANLLDFQNITYTTPQIEALSKCVIPSEVTPLVNYTGNMEELRDAEKFVVALLKIPNIYHKLNRLIFSREYENQITMIESQITSMHKACTEILESEKLKSIFGVVLAATNFLNYGTPLGRAKAIHESAFVKMEQFKATKKNKLSLSEFIVEYIEKNFDHCMGVYKELLNLEEASKYQPEFCRSELKKLEDAMEHIQLEIENKTDQDMDSHPSYFVFLSRFSKKSQNLKKLHQDWQDLELLGQKILNTFGLPEEPISPLPSILQKIHHFASSFKQYKEKRKQEEEERKRLHDWSQNWFGSGEADIYDDSFHKAKERRKEEREVKGRISIIEKLIHAAQRGEFPYDYETD